MNLANLKNCHGQYTDVQVSRCSKIVGSIGKAIEEIFYQEVVKDHIPRAAATDGTSRNCRCYNFESLWHGQVLEQR